MRCTRETARTRLPVLLLATGAALASITPAAADDSPWSFRLAISYIDAGGHDPHVLTVAGAQAGEENLETQSDIGRHVGARYTRGGKWSYGADFFFFTGAQELADRTASAEAAGSPVSFAITEREFASLAPGSVLFFQQLGDTDMNAWTFDLDLRRHWRYAPGDRFTYLVGLHVSRWADVAVPPGVRPAGSLETLYESSITFSGLMVGVEFGF